MNSFDLNTISQNNHPRNGPTLNILEAIYVQTDPFLA